ncbi:MAG: hypothetical protein FWC51_01975 [Proteobacteria bacterium]|nr:hypothetical protein [Pseudomonadota bacterium]
MNDNRFIIGLTTFHVENLRLSLPKLNDYADRIFLIIHNDNPAVVLTPERVRKYGFDGDFIVINESENQGQYKSRIAILRTVDALNRPEHWFIFVDDDDLLIDLTRPDNADISALQQDMIFTRTRLIDFLKILENSKNYVVDGVNITIESPHIGIVGTIFKVADLIAFNRTLTASIDAMRAIDDSVPFRAPEDIVMWFCFVFWLGRITGRNPGERIAYRPIANYAASLLDFAPEKYGRPKIPTDRPQEWYDQTLQRYIDAYLATI